MSEFPMTKFDNLHQIGGMKQYELIDGPGRNTRVVEVNTGSPLRYNVALDRGADIVEAFYGPHSLCYLTPNGIKQPSFAYSRGQDWLTSWQAGMMSTCGPITMGAPREENGADTGLHGKASNSIAELKRCENPDLYAGRHEMTIETLIRDSSTYGPLVELHRTIESTLGQASIRVNDLTINKDSSPSQHALMYHVNFGYPLLDEGARLIVGGKVTLWPNGGGIAAPEQSEDWKKIPAPMDEHLATNCRGFVIEPNTDEQGNVHAAVVNEKLGLGVEMIFPVSACPRLTVWQHFSKGMYVMGVEPMAGTPEGKAVEPEWYLELAPGESRTTSLELKVHEGAEAIEKLIAMDTPLEIL